MKQRAILCAAFFGLAAPAFGIEFTLAFLTGGDGLADEVAEAAFEWASVDLSAAHLTADGNGGFTQNGTARTLDQYAVVWIHHSASNMTPEAIVSDNTMDAATDYLEAGGSLFLSAQAVRYVSNLGVETNGNPRVFQPLGKGPPEIGVRPADGEENHPIFSGFDVAEPIFLCSMDQPGFTADFHGMPALDGKVIGTKTRGGGAGGGERPIVEYEVGTGRILTLGHHNAVYSDADSNEGENLRQITANILAYLAENSAFFSVEPGGKLSLVWGALKSEG